MSGAGGRNLAGAFFRVRGPPYELALETVRGLAQLNQRLARSARLTDAMASARESIACLQVAQAAGYLDAETIADPLEHLDHLVASLWNMVHRPWR